MNFPVRLDADAGCAGHKITPRVSETVLNAFIALRNNAPKARRKAGASVSCLCPVRLRVVRFSLI
jgi:hypothetical protein